MTEKSALQLLCEDLEHWETDPWAARAILRKEILTRNVVDAGCGIGILSDAAKNEGYNVTSVDVHNWGYKGTVIHDWLSGPPAALPAGEWTALMNPPFSKAEEFITAALDYGARKVVCFQRFAWWESDGRREFWDKIAPNRVFICGDRAHCFRHDLPKDTKGNRLDPVTGKKLSGTPTAHAFFVFECGHPAGTLLGHIYKGDLE